MIAAPVRSGIKAGKAGTKPAMVVEGGNDMAQGKSASASADLVAHQDTYHGFLRLTAAVVLACVFTVVALTAMTIIGGTAFWIGALGLIIGLASIAVTLATGLSCAASLVVLAAMVALTVVTL